MRTLWIGFFALAASGLAACGSDYCGNAQTFEQNALSRQGTCTGLVTLSNFSHSACEQALNSCSSQDQTELNNSAECLNAVSSCTPSTEGAFIGTEIDCVEKASSVSSECVDALTSADVPALVSGISFSSCGASGATCTEGSSCCSGTCTNNACQ